MARIDLGQFRRGTTTEWAASVQPLEPGEMGVEFDDDTGAVIGVKMGDQDGGLWTALPYLPSGPSGTSAPAWPTVDFDASRTITADDIGKALYITGAWTVTFDQAVGADGDTIRVVFTDPAAVVAGTAGWTTVPIAGARDLLVYHAFGDWYMSAFAGPAVLGGATPTPILDENGDEVGTVGGTSSSEDVRFVAPTRFQVNPDESGYFSLNGPDATVGPGVAFFGKDIRAGDDDGDGSTGFVAYSPDGSPWRILVSDAGVLSTEPAPF